MTPENLYSPAKPKTETAFNSSLDFCDVAHETTQQGRLAAESKVFEMIQEIKREIANER